MLAPSTLFDVKQDISRPRPGDICPLYSANPAVRRGAMMAPHVPALCMAGGSPGSAMPIGWQRHVTTPPPCPATADRRALPNLTSPTIPFHVKQRWLRPANIPSPPKRP